MWISNAPFADVAVVWAKDEQGIIRGLIVERGMEGFTTPETHGKWSLRASATGELVFDNVKVPKENLLPLAKGLKAPLSCLSSARFGIAWGAIGAALDCYDSALRYSLERIQFDKPIAQFQAISFKLADMATRIEAADLLTLKAADLKNRGEKVTEASAKAKYYASEVCVAVATDAVQIFGGYGYTKDFPVEKYYRDSKLCTIGEGTSEIQKLVIAREILK
jgi:glutaryl-CoA dehydrogenase